MYIRGRHIIGRRLVWERGAVAFGYPRGSGSGSGNLNSDDARETGSHLTAPAYCGMRVNGMRSSGLHGTRRLGRAAVVETAGQDEGRTTTPTTVQGDSIHLVPMYHSLPIRRFPGTCRPWSAAMGGFTTMVAALGSSCRITGMLLHLSCVAVETQCRVARERPVRVREGGASASGESWFPLPPRPGCSRASRGAAFLIPTYEIPVRNIMLKLLFAHRTPPPSCLIMTHTDGINVWRRRDLTAVVGATMADPSPSLVTALSPSPLVAQPISCQSRPAGCFPAIPFVAPPSPSCHARSKQRSPPMRPWLR